MTKQISFSLLQILSPYVGTYFNKPVCKMAEFKTQHTARNLFYRTEQNHIDYQQSIADHLYYSEVKTKVLVLMVSHELTP